MRILETIQLYQIGITHIIELCKYYCQIKKIFLKKTRPYNNQQKKKRICKIVDFAVPADHRIKLKECEKKDKYLDLAKALLAQ